MENLFTPDIVLRLPLYACIGIVAEVLFTGVADLLAPSFLQSWRAKNLPDVPPANVSRDPRAVGYTFLWMFPIYSLLAILEPLSQLIGHWPLILRGLCYLLILWFFEFMTGALIKKIIGRCPWDYSYSKYSFRGYIRWDFAPFWFGFTLIIERLSHFLVALTPAMKELI